MPTTTSRSELEWNNDFRFDLAGGELAQRFVENICDGKVTIEVKSEVARAWDTGNAYAEYESRGNPSGFKTTQAMLQATVFTQTKGGPWSCILTPTSEYREAARAAYRLTGCTPGGDNNTSKGVLMPIRWLTPRGRS